MGYGAPLRSSPLHEYPLRPFPAQCLRHRCGEYRLSQQTALAIGQAVCLQPLSLVVIPILFYVRHVDVTKSTAFLEYELESGAQSSFNLVIRPMCPRDADVLHSQEDGKAEKIVALARTLGVKNRDQFVAMKKRRPAKT